MRVEKSALVTLRKRLSNMRMLTRMAEEVMLCWTEVWGDAAVVPSEVATS